MILASWFARVATCAGLALAASPVFADSWAPLAPYGSGSAYPDYPKPPPPSFDYDHHGSRGLSSGWCPNGYGSHIHGGSSGCSAGCYGDCPSAGPCPSSGWCPFSDGGIPYGSAIHDCPFAGRRSSPYSDPYPTQAPHAGHDHPHPGDGAPSTIRPYGDEWSGPRPYSPPPPTRFREPIPTDPSPAPYGEDQLDRGAAPRTITPPLPPAEDFEPLGTPDAGTNPNRFDRSNSLGRPEPFLSPYGETSPDRRDEHNNDRQPSTPPPPPMDDFEPLGPAASGQSPREPIGRPADYPAGGPRGGYFGGPAESTPPSSFDYDR